MPAEATDRATSPLTVDLWTWPLDESAEPFAERLDAPSASLSADEQARADRFHHPRDRLRYIRARTRLREIIASYVDAPPRSLRFCYNRNGKPVLDTDNGVPPLHFNLSHSEGLAALAVCRDLAIGLDVEKVRPVGPEVAQQFFSRYERSALATLSGDDWLDGFFRLWTLKEAFLKARGDGLMFSLDHFDISFAAHMPPRLLRVAGDQAAPGRWTLLSFQPLPGFAGALAAPAGLAPLLVRNQPAMEPAQLAIAPAPDRKRVSNQ